MSEPRNDRERLLELLADRALGEVSAEDRAELAALLERAGVDPADEAAYEALVAQLVLAGDDPAGEAMPAALRQRLVGRGVGLVGGGGTPRSGGRGWALAAGLLIAAAGMGVLGVLLMQRGRALQTAEVELAGLRERVQANRLLLDDARDRAARLDGALAQAATRETDLAARLAEATADLDSARLAIARYEAPVDPDELKANRRRLLDVPGTVRLAWTPFDLPDAPAEQQGVEGDVVWNDELQQGFLRFVGLEVNDPSVEQYQVWVIDERGMEQKVSGGVFNATAMGEVIVPIEPGIDVGRVALFAITVENPGGTWVPDLSRRVVVGAREGG